ncbi:hypothetical protein [Polyangium jinanense]|uniref:Uncharacterized protein n=1 Tax=Polyangium jinanense TaxID=2829994 RepID=A0A9X3WZS0_9BACT|nr:hypothetical protein [Polyangium jinanense]MDC3953141.1 hypothetical protein [Polyangium jinanense]MDC3979738.1 hypothetical protein [Polyangium jinanense]
MSTPDSEIDRAYAAARFAEMSDEQLRAVVGPAREDYTEEARALAAAELQKRGARVDRKKLSIARRVQEDPRLGFSWLNYYPALLGMSGVGTAFIAAQTFWEGRSSLIAFLVTALQCSFVVTVAVLLSRRRAFGYYLHWVLPVAAIFLHYAPFALLWVVGNQVYLYRHRRVFLSTEEPVRPR